MILLPMKDCNTKRFKSQAGQSFGEYPMLVCSTNKIVLMTLGTADGNFKAKLIGKSISEYISSYDTIKYETFLSASEPKPFVAKTTIGFGYSYIMFFISNICPNEYVIAILFHNKNELLTFSAKNKALISGHINKPSDEAFGLFNVADVTKKLALALPYILNDNVDISFTDINTDESCVHRSKLNSYLKTVSFMVYTANTVYGSGKCSVSINQSGNLHILNISKEFEVKADTSSISHMRARHYLIEICRFLAGCTGCEFHLKTTESSVTLSLCFGTVRDTTDFKSPPYIPELDQIFDKLKYSFYAIRKEASREAE